MTAVTSFPVSVHNRIVRMLAFYAPQELDRASEWFRNWSGRESELLESLRLHYGPEPNLSWVVPASLQEHLSPTVGGAKEGGESIVSTERREEVSACRSMLLQVLSFYQPTRLVEVDRILCEWSHQLPVLESRLRSALRNRDSVLDWFHRNAPNRMRDACRLAIEFAGNEGWLLSYLESGLSNTGTDSVAMVPSSSSSSALVVTPSVRSIACESSSTPLFASSYETERMVWRQRLIELYRSVRPESLSQVDLVLQCFRGREAELFGHLHAQMAEQQQGGEKSTTGGAALSLHSGQLLTNEVTLPLVQLAAKWSPENVAAVEGILAGLVGTNTRVADAIARLASL